MQFNYTILAVNKHECSADVLYKREGYLDRFGKVWYIPEQAADLVSLECWQGFLCRLAEEQAPFGAWRQEDFQRGIGEFMPDLAGLTGSTEETE